jgi:hypothetical protein
MVKTLRDRLPAVAQTAARNQSGRAIAMTLMNPIKPGWTRLVKLNLILGRRFPVLLSGLYKLSFIHFARFCVIERFPYNGPPQVEERLRYDYFLFASNYNGYWMQYIDAFSHVVPRQMDLIWGYTYGYPRGAPPGPLKHVIREVESEYIASHYYSAYPEASATMVKSALELKRRFEDFQRRATNLEPEAFRDAYISFITEAQHTL